MQAFIMRSLMVILPTMFFAACTVSTQQLIGFVGQARDEVQRRLNPANQTNSWRLSFMGGEYFLTGVRDQGLGWLFYDALGIKVRFDGYEIRSVEGLPGAVGAITVSGQGSTRQIARGGNRIVQSVCSAPTEWQTHPDRFGWRILCRGTLNGVPAMTQQEVQWDFNKEPVAISAILIPGTAPLRLEKIPRPR
jgi:hypothetical protein